MYINDHRLSTNKSRANGVTTGVEQMVFDLMMPYGRYIAPPFIMAQGPFDGVELLS